MLGALDLSRLILRRLLDDVDSDQLRRDASDQFMQQVSVQLARSGVPVFEGVLPGQRAQPYLSSFHEAAQLVAERFIARHSGIEWLWYLRRLPGLFDFNRLRGTRAYCGALAEQLCGGSPVRGTIPITGRYSPDQPQAYDLIYLREAIWLIHSVHVAIRWAGKGADIRFSGLAAPTPEPMAEVRDAVRLYDDRRDRAPTSALGRLGLAPTPSEPEESEGHLWIPVVYERDAVEMVQIPGNHQLTFKQVEAGYGVGRLSLASYELLSNEQLLMSDSASRQMACAAIGLLSLSHPRVFGSFGIEASGVAIANILKVGYELTVLDDFHGRCAWLTAGAEGLRLPSWLTSRMVTADLVVETLTSIPISIHPPRRPRPILTAEDNWILIDWVAMTRLFLGAMERTGSGGAAANVWSAAFEERIQQWINQSEWRPQPEVARLRRRTLRRGGQALTDIDSVGAKRGNLLLLSCKSRPLSDAYERGEYAEVRNARTEAEQALVNLDEVLGDLRQMPVGDNFDFSDFRQIHGCVVYPFLPYVGPEWLRAEALSGLPAIVSEGELQQFLGVGE